MKITKTNLRNIIKEEINFRNNILTEAEEESTKEADEDNPSPKYVVIKSGNKSVDGLKGIDVVRPEDKYKYKWIPPGQDSDNDTIARYGAFLIVHSPSKNSKAIGKLILPPGKNKIESFDKSWDRLSKSLAAMKVDVESKLAVGSSEEKGKDGADLEEELHKMVGFIDSTLNKHGNIADEMNEIIDGYTSEAQFYQSWKMTEELILADDNKLSMCRVINGKYATVSGITVGDIAKVTIGVLGGIGAVALAPVALAAAGMGAAATVATGTAAKLAVTAAGGYGTEYLSDMVGNIFTDEHKEVMSSTESTELGQDWIDEASNESVVFKVIGNAIGNVWTNIATMKTYTKSQALADLKSPLDKQKIDHKSWSSA